MSELPELSDQEWGKIVERLTLYAQMKLARLTWFRSWDRKGGVAPGGVGPEDLASQAIVDTIEGRRQYNPDKYETFLAFLKGVVDSKVNHLVQLIENRQTRRLRPAGPDGEPSEAESRAQDGAGPAEQCANKELADKVREEVNQEFADDPVVLGVLDCIEAGIMKPSEMAEYLEVEPKDIQNAKKRLWRRFLKTHKECTA